MVADLPIVVLLVSVVVLFASTALLSWTLPAVTWRRWRRTRASRRRRAAGLPGRRVVTGRPPALPAGPVPSVAARRPIGPARQAAPGQDVLRRDDTTSEAEAMIDHLLDTDPDRLASLMMQWIRDDRRSVAHPDGRAPRRPSAMRRPR